ncbi:MAG: AAA family ATPase [Thermomicrobiales bacterium]
MTAPTMYLLTGLSFAGKSVLAREIARAKGATIVDPDEVAREQGLGLRGEFVSDEQWAVVHAEAERRARALLRDNQCVVYDTTGYNKGQRDRLRCLATGVGARVITIYVHIAKDLAVARWERNNQTGERFRVHADDFMMVLNEYQPPGADEAFVTYASGETIDSWIARMLP